MSTNVFYTISTISLESLNINFTEFMNFLNDNLILIFSGSLGLILLSLFILYTKKIIKTSTNSSIKSDDEESDNEESSDLTENNSNNNNNNSNTSRTDTRERMDRAFNWGASSATIITGLETVARVLPSPIAATNVAISTAVAAALGYHANSDEEQKKVNVELERSISPLQEDNFNPDGRRIPLDLSNNTFFNLSVENEVSKNPDKVSENPENTPNISSSDKTEYSYYVPSSNEDNLFDFIFKFFKKEKNQIIDFLINLIAEDNDPTMFYLFCLSVILCCILINLVILFFSLLVKMFKLEEKIFIKNKPLLYKLIINYNKVKDIKLIIILVVTIIGLLFSLLICNFMWDSFWYYK